MDSQKNQRKVKEIPNAKGKQMETKRTKKKPKITKLLTRRRLTA
jgi:hypothetical protein